MMLKTREKMIYVPSHPMRHPNRFNGLIGVLLVLSMIRSPLVTDCSTDLYSYCSVIMISWNVLLPLYEYSSKYSPFLPLRDQDAVLLLISCVAPFNISMSSDRRVISPVDSGLNWA